MVIKIRKNR